ncbi:MAG: hypothetical protein JWM33_2126, partial [Caulobacteraceae bacterium]|nr:hypothetical protein [Caulobacteraceae bacterium]
MNGTAIALALVQITVAPGPPRIAVGSVVVKAPRRLDILTEGELTATLRFLRDIRQVLRDEKKVFVDLADCDHIGMVGCLMLTAEIETCRAEWPDSIDGRDPMNPNAARMLASFGFHKLLGFNGTETLPATWLVGMKSGRGAVSDVAAQLGEVADLALRLWGDQAYADRVHAVLNEAVTNVIMHAYPPDIAGASSRRRWWALGAADIEEKEAIFIALDHGVSVPRTAIRTFGDMLDEFLDDPS